MCAHRRGSPQLQPFWLQNGCIRRGVSAMARSLTLKNLPDALYERLQALAQQHRRSLNSEAIVCLESVLQPPTLSGAVRLEQLRQLRTSLPPDAVFGPEEIDAFKREGRP